MSNFIVNAFALEFANMVRMVAQQKTSRLLPYVMMKDGVVGKAWTSESIGRVEANEVTSRHAPTAITETPHGRRWGTNRSFYVADLVDPFDLPRIKITPTQKYVLAHAAAMGRAMDRTIIEALYADSIQGEAFGASSVPFPASQVIEPTASTVLTVEKLLNAGEILSRNEVTEGSRVIVCTARDIRNLLNDNRIGSAEYNAVKALVNGEIDTYAGFRFVRSELLPQTATTTSCFAFVANMAVEFAETIPVNTSVDRRPDLLNNWQVLTTGQFGALRAEDEMVVWINNLKTAP